MTSPDTSYFFILNFLFCGIPYPLITTSFSPIFNSPLHVKHVQSLADWQSEKIFVYGGRRNKGNALFSSEEVAMYTESSAGYAGFKKTCKFPFRTSMLPYWPDAAGAPQNTIIGGASLWVLTGHSKEEYEGVDR